VKNARHIDTLADDAIDHHMSLNNKCFMVLGEVGSGVSETGVFCNRLESIIQGSRVFLLLLCPVFLICVLQDVCDVLSRLTREDEGKADTGGHRDYLSFRVSLPVE
jgi:hypothetical protein